MTCGEQEEEPNSSVDADHEKLVGLIDELRLMVLSRDDSSAIGEVLDELTSLASYEFSREEAFMRSTRAPHQHAHARLHREIVRQLGVLQERFEYEPDALEPTELYDWLSEWLVHVLSEDTSTRVTPEAAGATS
jgi:hemerythrin-like metal-binding protein